MTDIPFAAPADVGLDAGQLARVDAHVAGYIESGRLPGGLMLIARRGAIAHFNPLGFADRERGVALSRDTIFRIYSMTKPITSVALMLLLEQGRFQLDDPVACYIPAFKDLGVFKSGVVGGFETEPAGRPMTVRDLLTHMSGLSYDFQGRTNVDAAYRKLGLRDFDLPLAAWVETLASVPLDFSPGTAWTYSFSTDVLGHLIEVLSGEPFDDFLRTRIFEPLDMRDTAFFVPAEKAPRLAACYETGPDGALRLQDDPAESPYLARRAFLSGGGGLVSTAEDYWRFCQMLIAGGTFDGARILGRKTIELMTRNHLPGGEDIAALSRGLFAETPYEGMGFGLGFSVMLDPAKCQVPGTQGEFAWGGAASTYFWVDPTEELVAIFMTQFMPSHALNIRRELRTLVYAALAD